MTTRSLKLSKDLALPIEAVTQKFAWIGTTGSGKTYGASKLAELMWDAVAQFVVLDPVGVWYGLRLAKDGKKPSDITIPIFGGLHGDVPLESTSGALMADLVVDRAISAILDVSQFESDAQKARFAADFADRFFFRKKAAPSAVHLFLEECQEFIPENHQHGEERMKHAFTRMQKIGRNFGIGTSLITQRPQEVSKKALNLAQTLFVFRTTGTHERKAIETWIKDKSIEGQDISAELPKLKTGAPHVWSPEWLTISEVVPVLEKRTFNASATPEVGAAATARELAHIDLEKIRTAMAATIEKAKADDPRELRKTIADLKHQLAVKASAAVKNLSAPVGKPLLTDADRALIKEVCEGINLRGAWLHTDKVQFDFEALLADFQRRLRGEIQNAYDLMQKRQGEFLQLLDAKGFQKILGKLATVQPPQTPIPPTMNAAPRSPQARRVDPAPSTSRPARLVSPNGDGDASVGNSGLRRMLIALAQRPQGLTRARLGIRAGLSPKTGTFATYLGRLRSNGWVSGDRTQIVITEAGLQALGSYDPLPTGPDLAAYWLHELGGGMARMLQAAIDAYPQPIAREAMGRAANLSDKTGSFATYLGRLRSLELIEGRGDMRASEELFS